MRAPSMINHKPPSVVERLIAEARVKPPVTEQIIEPPNDGVQPEQVIALPTTTTTTIIVPSRFPDIFEVCRVSLDKFAPNTPKILVRDGHDIPDPPNWKTIQAPEGRFIYSRNINLGINQSTDNVLLMNDDARFSQRGTIEALEKVLAAHPEVGILSPKIVGGVGNGDQYHVSEPLRCTGFLAFVCVLIRREVIEKIGLLDEAFIGYGWDDVDYCRRAVVAGYKMAVTANASVLHGHGKYGCSASFSRTPRDQGNKAIYYNKWKAYKMACFPTNQSVRTVPHARCGYCRKHKVLGCATCSMDQGVRY